MEVVFHTDQLEGLLRDYHLVTGLRVGVYNTGFEEISAWPAGHSGFCKKIRSVPEGLSLCRACDRSAFLHATARKGVFIYHCHAGLAEAAAPILGQGETVGYVMIGQMRTAQHGRRELLAASRVLDSFGISSAGLEEEFGRLPLMEESSVPAYAHILQACASYLWLNHFVEVQHPALAGRFLHYVSRHLSDPLRLSEVAAALGTGKTTLCTAVRKEFGISAGDIIRRQRVEAARELLRQTGLTVASIAGMVGIPDYNYFTKVFQRETGMTPSAYRRQNRTKSP